jgi:tetratricopeptide (TPR) repeat protein
MFPIKNLVHEVHRRSLWQVLGIYLAVSWIVIQVVETLTESAGLPDWVPPFALVLLLIGLPIVLATAFVQEGVGGGGPAPASPAPADNLPEGAPEAGFSTSGAQPTTTADRSPAGAAASDPEGAASPPSPAPDNLAAGTGSLDRPSTRPSRITRLLTWRNAITGGVLAFAALGVLVVSYWFMWATGVGPVGSLVAQGVIEENDPIILAAFENATADPLMGDLVTSTLRVDLVESPVIALVEPRSVQNALQRMGREPSELVTADLAQEIAIREGLKATIEGEVRAAGSQVVITAIIRGAAAGESLAAFRVVAEDEARIVAAIDELSQDIRERAGESLRSIRAGEPLENVTTGSLEALRKFTEAEQLTEQGDDRAAMSLLEDAVELDPEFAMAYRRIAVIYANNNLDPERMIDAATRAYELSSRRADRERYLAEAFYHDQVTGDREATIQAYRAVLRSHPDDQAALNNLANEYIGVDDEAAIELYRRANEGPGESNTSNQNLVRVLLKMGRMDEAREAQSRYETRYPADLAAPAFRYWVHFLGGEFDAADSVALDLAREPNATARWQTAAHRRLAATDLFHGRIRDASDHLDDAIRAAAEQGPTAEFFQVMSQAALYVHLDVDPARGMRMLDDAQELLERVPPVARPYLFLSAGASIANQPDRAEAFIEAWEATVPVDYQTDDGRANRTVAEGLLAWRRGDPAGALELVDQGRQDLGCVNCWQFERALVIEDLGAPGEAIAGWEERANAVDLFFYVNATEWPIAYEKLCHLHAEHGETTAAAQYCSRFVDLWADADPELQPRVRAAQQRLDAVTEG